MLTGQERSGSPGPDGKGLVRHGRIWSGKGTVRHGKAVKVGFGLVRCGRAVEAWVGVEGWGGIRQSRKGRYWWVTLGSAELAR